MQSGGHGLADDGRRPGEHTLQPFNAALQPCKAIDAALHPA